MKTPLLIFLFALVLPRYVEAQCTCDMSTDFQVGVNGSRLVASCTSVASCFKCHQFVRSFFEDPNCLKPGVYTTYNQAYTCPNIQDGSPTWTLLPTYLKTCSEADADAIFYDLVDGGGEGDHSAVKVGSENGAYRYVSKYGTDGPLVNHTLNGSWYSNQGRVTSIDFYIYLGTIQGATSLTGTAPVTYSLLNKPGVTYYWYSSNGNVSIANPSSAAPTITPQHSGTVTLYCNTTTPCGNKTSQITINVQTNICLEGDFKVGGAGPYPLWTTNKISTGSVDAWVTCPGVSNFNWQRTSGSIGNGSWYQIGTHVYFTMPTNGSISFNVSGGGQTRSITFYNSGYYMVYPNPANSYIMVEATAEQEFTVTITDMNGRLRKTVNRYYANQEINVLDLEPGDYLVSLSQNDKELYQQRIKIER